jgi:hypothetical protein
VARGGDHEGPRPAIGHMPFPGSRTCAEWGTPYLIEPPKIALGSLSVCATCNRAVTRNDAAHCFICRGRGLAADREARGGEGGAYAADRLGSDVRTHRGVGR